MQRYYQQSFPRSTLVAQNGDEDPKSGAALVRKLLADKNSALVPRKGGFGAYGSGTDVVKARNRGEAREAGRHVREFRDQKRREDFKTKVAYISNNQKHYRDPLLQVCFTLDQATTISLLTLFCSDSQPYTRFVPYDPHTSLYLLHCRLYRNYGYPINTQENLVVPARIEGSDVEMNSNN